METWYRCWVQSKARHVPVMELESSTDRTVINKKLTQTLEWLGWERC